MNTKFLELFEGTFFALIHMKLIDVRNNAFKCFFSIAVHGDLKKNDRIILTSFFYKIGKNQKQKNMRFVS